MTTCSDPPQYFRSPYFVTKTFENNSNIRIELCTDPSSITLTSSLELLYATFPDITWQIIVCSISVILILFSGCLTQVKSVAQRSMRLSLLLSSMSCIVSSIGLGFCTYQIRFSLEKLQCENQVTNTISIVATVVGLSLSILPGVFSVLCILAPFIYFRSIFIIRSITIVLSFILSLSIMIISMIASGLYKVLYNLPCTKIHIPFIYDALDMSSILVTMSGFSMLFITYSLYSLKQYPKLSITMTTLPESSMRI